jgi:hypothetical protein
MKALNTNERNSAILRFSLWLVVCVLVISIPVILTLRTSAIKTKVELETTQAELTRCRADIDKLNNELLYLEKNVAVQIREIVNIQTKFTSDNLKVDLCNQELLNIEGKLYADTTGRAKWMIEINKNLAAVSGDFRDANNLISQCAKGKNIDNAKLNAVINKFQSLTEDIGKQLQFDSWKTLHAAFERIYAEIKSDMEDLKALRP